MKSLIIAPFRETVDLGTTPPIPIVELDSLCSQNPNYPIPQQHKLCKFSQKSRNNKASIRKPKVTCN